ncbi:hypothetical protein GUJ93_ZPchr0002g23909 [Zizania palustris]|uniref:Uncharacterized protein n=1 Tax=Zizania palustris TaxID=103762 RepID=A0A8J5ST78_ZIZPA|nr:hypothetical protein GUJ93_ZPchr0002g23909 [Zizania palustris]
MAIPTSFSTAGPSAFRTCTSSNHARRSPTIHHAEDRRLRAQAMLGLRVISAILSRDHHPAKYFPKKYLPKNRGAGLGFQHSDTSRDLPDPLAFLQKNPQFCPKTPSGSAEEEER